jgi:hypothetical protein
MAVTRVQVAGREQYFQQVERLVNNHILHGSESLCKLLRYLAEHSLDHPGTSIKEYQIATEVFGRPADFDPHMDSTVRVQAGRLRVKLAEYYASEGIDDPLVIELPKGSYALSFHHRAPMVSRPPQGGTTQRLASDVSPRPVSRKLGVAVAVLSVLLAVAIIAIVALVTERARSASTQSQPAPTAYQIFWKRFITNPEEPWVIFSNAAFVGRPETGMRYFNAARDVDPVIMDHYTGVGEVLAIHELDRAFNLLHRSIRVKRGTLFSLDDAKNNDLIFVGSPAENLTLREIPATRQFVFQRLTSGPRKGDLAIVNVSPQPDEPKQFLGTPSTEPLTEDYAVVALVPGLNPARSVLILAGTTTMGTQAAVEYVCRQDSLEELLLRLSVSKTGELTPFEAVLRVKVTRGVPVHAELVALRNGTTP